MLGLAACNQGDKRRVQDKPSPKAISPAPAKYRSVAFVDSFISARRTEIDANNALRQKAEAECTKIILPKIEKEGFYSDLPFKLVTTQTHNGVAYGNFIYDDSKHYAKVQCKIGAKALSQLRDGDIYRIGFKPYKFDGGINFENDFGVIELPEVLATLTSAHRVK